MTVKEYMVQNAIAMANDNKYGYRNDYPNNRFGQGNYPNDGDCGAFVSYNLNKALGQAGINENGYYEPIGYNGGPANIANEDYLLKYCDRYNYGSVTLQRGDILLSGGHTVIMTGSDQIVHASGDKDGRSGDSGGNEIFITGWFNLGWIYVYRLKNQYGGKNAKGSPGKGSSTKTFKERTKSPTGENNPCYMTTSTGPGVAGSINSTHWNTCITGSPVMSGANVLRNCTGYAQGRALEIYCELENYNPGKTGSHPFQALNGDAGSFVDTARSANLTVSQDPAPGAIMCWKTSGAGHVAVVEKVIDKNTVIATESGWGAIAGTDWISHKRYRGSGNWDGDKFTMGGYTFAGFILNPAKGTSGSGARERRPIVTRVPTDEEIKEMSKRLSGYDLEFNYEDVTVTKTFQGLVTSTDTIARTQGAKLLSYPSLVEAPFVILKVGKYSFGTYTKDGDLNKIARVTYPNFIQGMTVQKVNGTVNQYTINLVYQIEAGNDPNLVDKILSTVSYDLIYISYGDWSCPTFIYKEEQALITNVKSQVDFSQSKISYTITCTSNSIALAANTFNFPMRKAKPSDVIFEMLYSNQYGLLDLFTGMRNSTTVRNKGLLATNDQVVEIPSKEGIDPLTYLNYLVTCMSSNTTSSSSVLRDSTYYLTVNDDSRGELGGPYFTITEVKVGASTLAAIDTYEVDVGFPSDNLVTNFSIKDDNSWALLYNYASQIDNQRYVYSLDDNGKVVTRYSPNITTSTKGFITTEAQKTWWTNMTQFPISATLEIKGLLRPSMLMSYVRINAFFYGQRHISSGLYIITGQTDTINGNGYKTTLSLVRIGGDYDYISNVTKKVTTQRPTITLKKTDSLYNYVKEHNLVKSISDKIAKLNESQGGSTVHTSASGQEHGGGGGSF